MNRGFTLVELLFTVVVAALLLTLAAPSFQSAVRNSAMTTSTNNIIASLQLARSEALKRRAPVTICPSANAEADAAACADVDWHEGYIVFSDDNGNSIVDGADVVLHAEPAMSGSVTVTLPPGQPLQNSLTYLPTGFPRMAGLAAVGRMVLCDDRQSNQFGRVIVISQTGRPQAAVVENRPDLGDSCQ